MWYNGLVPIVEYSLTFDHEEKEKKNWKNIDICIEITFNNFRRQNFKIINSTQIPSVYAKKTTAQRHEIDQTVEMDNKFSTNTSAITLLKPKYRHRRKNIKTYTKTTWRLTRDIILELQPDNNNKISLYLL